MGALLLLRWLSALPAGLRTNLRHASTRLPARREQNEEIRVPEVFFIDQDNLGKVWPVAQLLETVDRQKYDLVVLNKECSPPIARLVSREKEFQRRKSAVDAASRQRRMCREKEFRFGTSMSAHDIDIKYRKMHEHMSKGYRIKLVVQPKGIRPKTPLAKEAFYRELIGRLQGDFGRGLEIVSAPQVQYSDLVAVVCARGAAGPSGGAGRIEGEN